MIISSISYLPHHLNNNITSSPYHPPTRYLTICPCILRSTIDFSFDLFWDGLDLILLHITSLAISMAAFVHTVESRGFFLVVATAVSVYVWVGLN
jgi:hypothetical protein